MYKTLNSFIFIFLLSSICSANEKFSIDGNTLIYDTFKAQDEVLAEINWEDSDIWLYPNSEWQKIQFKEGGCQDFIVNQDLFLINVLQVN